MPCPSVGERRLTQPSQVARRAPKKGEEQAEKIVGREGEGNSVIPRLENIEVQ